MDMTGGRTSLLSAAVLALASFGVWIRLGAVDRVHRGVSPGHFEMARRFCARANTVL
jgi:hypothetical protein